MNPCLLILACFVLLSGSLENKGSFKSATLNGKPLTTISWQTDVPIVKFINLNITFPNTAQLSFTSTKK